MVCAACCDAGLCGAVCDAGLGGAVVVQDLAAQLWCRISLGRRSVMQVSYVRPACLLQLEPGAVLVCSVMQGGTVEMRFAWRR